MAPPGEMRAFPENYRRLIVQPIPAPHRRLMRCPRAPSALARTRSTPDSTTSRDGNRPGSADEHGSYRNLHLATAATQLLLDLKAQVIREPFRLVDFVVGHRQVLPGLGAYVRRVIGSVLAPPHGGSGLGDPLAMSVRSGFAHNHALHPPLVENVQQHHTLLFCRKL